MLLQTERSKRKNASASGARQRSVNMKGTTLQLPELPHEVLCHVQQYVGLKHLLSSCSLVCKAWKQAADAVTTSLDVAVSESNHASLVSLLSTHGSRLEALSLSRLDSQGRYLPQQLRLSLRSLGQLKTLSIDSLSLLPPFQGHDRQATVATTADAVRTRAGRLSKKVSVAASASNSRSQLAGSSLGHLTALTRLQVSFATLDFRHLYKCTVLRHLQLEHTSQQEVRGGCSPESMFVGAMAAAMRQLTELTHLSLVDMHKPCILQGISNLQHLQHLALYGSATVWQGLAINLDDLTHANLSGLTGLELVHVCLANGDTALGYNGAREYVEQTDLLPAALNNLRQLRHLDLKDAVRYELTNEAEYSSLTTATQLTYLGLKQCAFSKQAWQHVFPASRHLAQLQHMVVPAFLLGQRGSFQRLVSCCPNLQQLHITGRCIEFDEVEDGYVYLGEAAGDPKGIAELAQLQSLTKLELRGLALCDGKMDEVADLIQLKHLDIKYACDLSGNGLHALTRLSNLEYLRVLTADFDGSSEASDVEYDEEELPGTCEQEDTSDLSHNIVLYNQAVSGGIPDVSQQLETICVEGEVMDWDSSDDESFDSDLDID